MARLAAVLALATWLATPACGSRRSLTPTHGRSYQAAFSRQAPVPAKITSPAPGLDPQEANLIADAYRLSLVPKKAKVTEEPVILVAPPNRGGAAAAMLPPPSVPSER